MTDTAAFVGAVNRSLRRSLFQKLAPLGLSQDQVTRLVADATSRAIVLANVKELATAAQIAAPVVQALRETAPSNPALATYEERRAQLPGRIQDVMDAATEV